MCARALALLLPALLPAAARGVVYPQALEPGSRIALITPSSAQDSLPIIRAAEIIAEWGYEPVLYPHTFGKRHGSYSASDSARVADIEAAFADTTVRAILCTRGGFGATHMLPMLDTALIRRNPKWLIGYSDVSALHALLRKAGVASIHAPMSGHMADEPDTDPALHVLRTFLADGEGITYNLPASPWDNPGKASGLLYGGNLIVLNGLAETPWDLFNGGREQDMILFIEDVNEKIDAVERMLLRLHQSGALGRLKGLIIGKFTEYSPNDDFESMEQMFHTRLQQWGYLGGDFPVVFGFPVGHVTENMPMIEGAEATLTVTDHGVDLRMATPQNR